MEDQIECPTSHYVKLFPETDKGSFDIIETSTFSCSGCVAVLSTTAEAAGGVSQNVPSKVLSAGRQWGMSCAVQWSAGQVSPVLAGQCRPCCHPAHTSPVQCRPGGTQAPVTSWTVTAACLT